MQEDSPWKPPADRDDVAPASREASAEAFAVAQPPGTMPPPGAPTVPVSTPAPQAPPPAGMFPVEASDRSDAVVVTSPDGRTRRSRWLVAGAASGAIAVGAAGIFAVANLAGTAEGGADSPADLGLQLLAAIEQEDVLGVVDTLSPGERDVFRDPLVDLVDELTRLELLSPDADLARLLGVDVEFEGESASEAPTNVADIVNVDLRADATITVDGGQVPIGALITDNMPEELLAEMRGTRQTETDELDFRLTAVEENGRWYFSVFHTIAEIGRAEAAPGTLIPPTGIGADGFDTPDEAFDNLLQHVEALDLSGIIRTLNPGEAAALQRYAPIFLDEAEAELAAVPLEWQITQSDVRVESSGETATVFVDGFAVEGTIDGDAFSASFSDGCIRAEGMGESFEQCESDTTAQTEELFQGMPEVQKLLDTFTEAFSDIEELGLEMRRHDGKWYVSPLTTGSEAVLAVLRALDRTEIDAIVDQAPRAFEEFVDGFFGGFGLPNLDDGSWESFPDEFAVEDMTFDDMITDDMITDDGFGEFATGDMSAWDQCYSITDPTEASDCFFAASASEGIDEEFIPLVLRHPECNYTSSWGGQLYEMSDEEFTAAAEAARSCFLDLVARGEVEEYELPTEIAYLECFEGRNWYNSFEDEAYDERYFACLEDAYAGE